MSLIPSGLSIERACELLELAPSTYYYSQQLAVQLAVPDSAKAIALASATSKAMELRDRIEQLCLEFIGYGYRRVTAQLRREGWRINHKRVLRIMRQESLLCHVKRAFTVTTDSRHGFRRYPNLLEGLAITRINQVWVADITYIRLQRDFVYLSVILDSYSRRVVGWALDNTMESVLCLQALEMALQERKPPVGWVHHSDQGTQYASTRYTDVLCGAGAEISMSRRGNPYDNARVESFMKTLKKEEVHLIEFYEDLQHARERISAFLIDVYNNKRLHSSLGYKPPVEFEQAYDLSSHDLSSQSNTQGHTDA